MPDRTSTISRTELVDFTGTVSINVRDQDVFDRVTGPGGDEWRSHVYPDIKTEADVLAHFTRNAVFNGVTRANRLDGWADLADDAAFFTVVEVSADDQ